MKKEWQNPKYIVGAVAVMLIASWFMLAGGKKEAPAMPAVVVSTVEILRKDVPLTIQEIGTVTAYETVGVRSRIDSQVVVEVKFHDGDLVHKDDLLFLLDDRTLVAQRDQIRANLQRDKAQLENLHLQYTRMQDLASKGYVSASDLDNARAAYEVQKATVEATDASLKNILVQLQYTRITAPITGRTGTIMVTAGNTVKANDSGSLVTINQIQPIRVQMTLSQDYFEAVRNAMTKGKVKVTAMRENSKQVSEGTLEYVDNAVNQSSGTFITRAVFANSDETLWPGMFVTVSIILGSDTQVIAIPEVAVQHGQAGDYVFVIDQGKAKRQAVKVKRNQAGMVVIAEGLQEHQFVAVDGMLSLKDGATVTVKK